MKQLFRLSAAALGILAFTGEAQAQVITSVQFSQFGNVLGTTQPAGTAAASDGGNYFVPDWNVISPPDGDRNGVDSPLGASVSLMTSAGKPSDITFSLPYSAADNTGNTFGNFPSSTPTDGDRLLAIGGVANNSSSPLTLSLSGLTSTDNYTIIAYVSSLFFGIPSTVAVSDGTQTYDYIPTASGTGFSGWVQGTATGTPTDPATSANFVEFDNYTGSSTAKITLTGTGGGDAALMGFQVIDLGPVTTPEPSTYLLLGLGFLGLVVLRRRQARL